ncbi:amidohydrolase family protein [Roseitranquillus sediminis]|uniref:amidohydrolase family protein n=1 Tax=Roseitranquillus sediminis TaxID=2809051 RepID=UPI001D0CA348|nr:amidohydrolase family protein [Roseitranquillus sediminis]MBM9593179.1 amidohydrolase [Roseitranquillus sediminis]
MNVADRQVTKVRDLTTEPFNTSTHLAHAQQQADARGYEDFLIVDVDSHHYENEASTEIADYVENEVMRNEILYQGISRKGISTGFGQYQDLGGRLVRYPRRKSEEVPETPHRDITLMRRWMDAMGVDIACMFPTPLLNLGLSPRVDLEVELAMGYNRWLCERVLQEDHRLKSMLYLPFNDPEACLKVIEMFGDKPGVIGFMVTSTRYRGVYDNAYVRTYRMLEERGLPLGFHTGLGGQEPGLSTCNRFLTLHALGFAWHNMLHLSNWVINGLPERFPKLKVMWIEAGLAWLPFLMQRLDNEYMMRHSDAPLLKRKPSEYMREMFYTSQPMEMVDNARALELTFEMIGAETQLLYSSDYPHWDMDLPSVIYDLPFLTEGAKRNILGGNAQRVFNLDPVLSERKRARQAEKARASA